MYIDVFFLFNATVKSSNDTYLYMQTEDKISYHCLLILPATCSLDATMAQTFDNMTYPLKLDRFWRVAAISTPELKEDGSVVENRRFAILVREPQQGHRELRVIVDDSESIQMEMTPTSSQMKVAINEKEIELKKESTVPVKGTNGETVMELTHISDMIIKAKINNFQLEVVFDNERMMISTSPMKKMRIGGLCGNLDGESFDLITPRGQYTHDIRHFLATWAYKPEGEIKDLAELNVESYVRRVHQNIVSEQDAGRQDKFGKPIDKPQGSSEDRNNKYGEPLKKIVVIEHQGKHCFSVKVHPACKLGYKADAVDYQMVDFVCVERNDTSKHWMKLVERGAKPDFSKKGTAQQISYGVPVSCTKGLKSSVFRPLMYNNENKNSSIVVVN